MRLRPRTILATVAALSALAAAIGCATNETPDAEETPNLASRRPLPSPSSTSPSAPTSTPEDDAAPSTPPARDAGGGNDGAPSTSDAEADTFVPPVDASGIAVAAPGDVAITEVLFDPNGTEPENEWIEIGSRASAPRTLRGLTLQDGAGRTHVVASDVVVAPGKYVVLARSRASATAQGITPADVGYEYGAGASSSQGIILANGSTGSIALLAGATVLARVPYGSFGLAASGASIELRAAAAPGSQAAADYCVSTAAFGGQLATPGRASSCP